MEYAKLPWECTFGNIEQSYPALVQVVYPMPNKKTSKILDPQKENDK